MKTVIIVQARMGSSRLPGKVLKKVLDRPLLAYQMERLQRCDSVDEIMIATSIDKRDDVLDQFYRDNGIRCFRGSEDDVLERYYLAAKEVQADVVVRVTGDCPLIDPVIIDQVINFYLDNKILYDYVSLGTERTYPRGMDTEVFPFWVLEKSYKEAYTPAQHEHVTPYIYQNPQLFRIGSLIHEPDLSCHRWTVDQEEDFVLIEKIISNLYPVKPNFTMYDILDLFRLYPEWVEINAHVEQKKV